MTQKFGAYEILHELSTGGMGSVLLGRRRGPGAFEQLVAIKTIKPEYAQAAAVRAMFLDEAAILARLAHPGIATVHDFGEEAGALYMVMEYVAGNSFRSLIDGPMPPAVAARAIAEACRGLHAAHDVRDTSGALLGVVHRDISPDNLMLGFDGHVKVIDFGIALVKNRQAPVTEFGTVKGKPPYMSPEQVKNEAIDRRSDVFSLGVVLHEMLTGRSLFDGDSIYAIARAVEHQPIAPPSTVIGAPLPTGLDAAVMRALDRDLSRRTPTAAQFAEELERVIGAAGDETLEAWAERELAPAREAHRTWLAGVVAGRDAPKHKVGRATGAVTAVGAEALAALGAHAPVNGIEREDASDTPSSSSARRPDDASRTASNSPSARRSNDADAHAKTAFPSDERPRDPASDDHRDVEPRRRSLAIPIIGLLLIAATVVVVIAMMRGAKPNAIDAGVIDAPVANDAPMVVEMDASQPIDASEVIDANAVVDAARSPIDATTIDATPPIDAPRRAPIDAAPRAPVDARTAEVRVDAAILQATGSGIVTFNNPPKGSSIKFVTIVLDGKNLGTTPILGREVPAGHHEVQFVGVDRTETTSFDLSPGEHKKVTPPKQ